MVYIYIWVEVSFCIIYSFADAGRLQDFSMFALFKCKYLTQIATRMRSWNILLSNLPETKDFVDGLMYYS